MQKLSAIIKLRLDVTVLIVDNAGYGCERLIHGLEAGYNDVAPWRYCEVAGALGAPRPEGASEQEGSGSRELGSRDGYTVSSHRAKTWAELDALLGDEKWVDAKGLKVVDIVVGREDVPGKFKGCFEKRAGR